jgi:mycothiol synthase
VRELRQMRRPLTGDDAAAPEPAPGVRLRSFVVGQDEPAWLRVNAAAFAHHPEQGRTTLDDLREREQEAWFDPAGFLLAEDEDDGALLGFHWTKVHPATADAPAAGEVYVLGVDPAAQGRRLGATLLQAGLAHLAATRDGAGEPLGTVLLYVEADNGPAVRLYERQGFEVAHVDVRYRLTRP